MGSLALREKLLLYPAKRVRTLTPGSVGVVFQSGGTFQFWLQQAALRGLDFSYAVSSGNELDLDLADYINFLVEDEHTKIIACLVEGIRRPQAFMAAAEKALAAKSRSSWSRSGAASAARPRRQPHRRDRQRRRGVRRGVPEIRHSALPLARRSDSRPVWRFTQGRLPKGNRIAMACYSGGAKGLVLDYAGDEGAEMAPLTPETRAKLPAMIDPGLAPENPLDVGPTVGVQAPKFAEICKVICADPTVDLVTVQGLMPVNPDDPYDPAPLRSVMASTDKPVLAFGRIAQNASEISRKYPERNRRAVHSWPAGNGARAAKPRPLCGGVAARRRARCRSRAGARTISPAPRFDALLASHGLTPPKSALAETPDEAAAQAASIGFPVAVKIVSPQASHKTEVGGVALGLRDAAAVRAAREAMASAARRSRSARAASKVSWCRRWSTGVEMILGVREDPQFGPFMLVGLGGVMVEVMRDVAIRLLPIDEETARDMIALAARRGAARRIPRPAGARHRRRGAGHDRALAAVPRSPAVALRSRNQSADRARQGRGRARRGCSRRPAQAIIRS